MKRKGISQNISENHTIGRKGIFFWLSCLSALLLSLVLFGCAPVGPDYAPPAVFSPKTWHTDLKYGLTAKEPGPETLASW